MEQQDYFEREINKIGILLGKTLADMIGLKVKAKFNEAIEMTNHALKGELDFDIEELLAIPAANFINTLKAHKGFNNENLEKLADILLFIADNTQGRDKNALYEKCLAIYEYLEKAENIYSFDRRARIERVKSQL